MLKSKELRSYVMPIAVINSIFCTGLLEYFTDRSTHVIGFFYVICALIIYCKLFSMLANILHTVWIREASDVALVMIHLQFYHNIIAYVLTVIAGVIRRKKVRLSMRQLENCTRAMDDLGIPESYSPLIRHKYLAILSFSVLLVGIVISELCSIIGYKNYIVVALYCLADNIPSYATFIVDFSFVYWIRYAKMKLGQLNMVLRSMLTSTIESPQHRRVLRVTDNWKNTFSSSNIYQNCKMSENVRKLKKIKEIHLELIKFARNTNEAYGLHILMSMTMCFLLTTTLLYNLYYCVISNTRNLKPVEIIIFTYWMGFILLELFFVNHMCAITSMERYILFIIFPHAAETGDILCELYEPSASKEFRDAVREFMDQVVQNPLTFTAWGFFDLDYTFINNTIGAITTYLIILIQVGHVSKKEPNNVVENSTSTT